MVAGQAGEVRCVGAWTLATAAELEGRLAAWTWPSAGEVAFDATAVTAMDTSGAWLLHRTARTLERCGRTVQLRGLSREHESLLRVIAAREVALEAPVTPAPGMIERLGRASWENFFQTVNILTFIGECAVALLRCIAQPRRIRWRAILRNIQMAGFDALPIAGLLSFLMGIVIAYQGAEQLRRYGANIFVADLVGLSMLRELSPLLTAIIVAGRSGSAWAAQIGTMKVTEEIDALRTAGVVPMELLVLPKLLALVIALPLLSVYADVMGVFGGMIMARAQLDVTFTAFLDRLDDAISLSSYLIGIGKAPLFAAIIAIVGCYQGFQVSGSADSVGRQTTVSVVQAIFLVIVTDSLLSIVFSWLDL